MKESFLKKIDWITLLLYLILIIIGWISIYAAVYDEQHKFILDLTQRYGKQALWIGIAIFSGIIIFSLDIAAITSPVYLYYALTILLMSLTYFIAPEIKGAKAWIQLGDFALQPSEFAKITTALALAKFLGNPYNPFGPKMRLIIASFIILLPAIITLLQNDTGSALVFLSFIIVLHREQYIGNFLTIGIFLGILAILSLYFNEKVYDIAGLNISFHLLLSLILFVIFSLYLYSNKLKLRRNKSILRHTIILYIITLLVIWGTGLFFDHILEPHQKVRINILLGKEFDPKGSGYNLLQSLIAIGSGGLTGKGFLQGTQTKYNFVPEQSTDFIFCTIGEEWGFLGTSFFIIIFIGLLFRIMYLAERQRSAFSRIYGYGLMAVLFFHFVINIGMTIGLMPVIGIPLPFISYGGSSMIAFSIFLFIFLKLDMERYYMIR
ncbi:MAG: rod shape-determining protein RodA [Vicingaceae bacterium]|nr:MAG: rod shape-determining protein RodA [Vicingaceae bacterium]